MSEITPTTPLTLPPVAKGERLLLRQVRDLVASPEAAIGLAVLITLVAIALLAPLIAPQNPYDLMQLDIMDNMLPPGSALGNGATAWLGTDDQGRDMLSTIMYGMRVSLGVGIASVLIASVIGALIGVLSAYIGGRFDALIMRIVDLQLSFPSILIALVLLTVFGRGLDKVVLSLVFVQWAYYARTVRASALVEKNKDYIAAARCLEMPQWRILVRHMLPNCIPPLIVVSTVQVAHAITLESTLSYLGVGVPVTQPSLGMLIATGYSFLLSGNYWISTYPGIALVLIVVSINLVGDRLRAVLNPRFTH
ncbi:ABC transporter permease [Rhizobium oryzicola]|uniref:ABC transporter permease n=1 Tax=Rhizobium oryzicola TaxID=1232668 RepID=A0ABT8SWM1_9HYPH|nr:ABC transporter permease [Rhizobium oryzicola]MDO1582710.1 ABC transporter permease [Rhizobium oryzicola]